MLSVTTHILPVLTYVYKYKYISWHLMSLCGRCFGSQEYIQWYEDQRAQKRAAAPGSGLARDTAHRCERCFRLGAKTRSVVKSLLRFARLSRWSGKRSLKSFKSSFKPLKSSFTCLFNQDLWLPCLSGALLSPTLPCARRSPAQARFGIYARELSGELLQLQGRAVLLRHLEAKGTPQGLKRESCYIDF